MYMLKNTEYLNPKIILWLYWISCYINDALWVHYSFYNNNEQQKEYLFILSKSMT